MLRLIKVFIARHPQELERGQRTTSPSPGVRVILVLGDGGPVVVQGQLARPAAGAHQQAAPHQLHARGGTLGAKSLKV